MSHEQLKAFLLGWAAATFARGVVMLLRLAFDRNHHVKGCGTERRGCMPGCDNYDPRYDG